MNTTFDQFGVITEDVEGATTCFPNDVRLVRWLKSSKGNELTAMVRWYVPDGEHAQLIMMQISPGHSSVDPKIVQEHSCTKRVSLS